MEDPVRGDFLQLFLIVALFSITFVMPGAITWLKGQRAAFFVGLAVGGVWAIYACRLARPSSWWARRFYGPQKIERSVRRYGSPATQSLDG